MVTTIAAIARNTFLESVRQPIYFVLVALAAVFQVFTASSAAFSMGYTESTEVSGDNKVLLDISLATVFVCGMLLAAFLATSVISREIERKTVLTVVSKPVARPAVVIGKYLGVVGAILIAVISMLIMVQLALRHEVLQTAADKLDGPVLTFGIAAVVIALAAGIWCNFFYGWVFSQTATLLLCPLLLIAWVLVLLLNKEWTVQPFGTNLKPQVLLASGGVLMAQLVLAAVATAASARLGQVMTIVVCCGVFLMGLLSNHFLGRRAVDNLAAGRVSEAAPLLPSRPELLANGDGYTVTLEFDSRQRIEPGASLHYGPNPSGLSLATSSFPRFDGDLADIQQLSDRTKHAGIVVTRVEGRTITVQRVGADDRINDRPPQRGDFIFLNPTKYRPLFFAAWVAVPNVQSFWLVDAVTQNQPIPASHFGLLAIYALFLVGVFLSLAVALFQKREVG